MNIVDIEELHHEAAAILRRGRDGSEAIAISKHSEVVAHIVSEPPIQAERMSIDRLAERLARPSCVLAPEERAARSAQTDAALARLKEIGAEISHGWPMGEGAVGTIRHVCRDL